MTKSSTTTAPSPGAGSRFARLTPETATGAASEMLADLAARQAARHSAHPTEDRFGDAEPKQVELGAMVSTMAHSPAVLGGYLQLSRAMGRAKLDRRLAERVSLAVQAVQGCEVCLDAHEGAARALGVEQDEIDHARRGTSADPKIAALVAFGRAVYQHPSSITDEQVEGLRAYGYSDRQILDVVGIVALNVITGAFNLVAGITPR